MIVWLGKIDERKQLQTPVHTLSNSSNWVLMNKSMKIGEDASKTAICQKSIKTGCISYLYNMKTVVLHKRNVFYVFRSSSSSHSKANFETFLGGETSKEEFGEGLPRFAGLIFTTFSSRKSSSSKCSIGSVVVFEGESAGSVIPKEAAMPLATWERASASLDGSNWLVEAPVGSPITSVTNLSGET